MRNKENQKNVRKSGILSHAITKYIAAATAVALGGAGIFSYTGSFAKDSANEMVAAEGEYFLTERAQLNEISDYLDNVDKLVQTNQDQLSAVGLNDGNAEGALEELQANLTELEENVSAVGNSLDIGTFAFIDETATEKQLLVDARTRQEEISAQINSALNSINILLLQIKSDDQAGFADNQAGISRSISGIAGIAGSITALQEAVAEIQGNANSYNDDLGEIIASLQNQNQQDHQKLANDLTNSSAKIEMLITNQSMNVQMLLSQNYMNLMQQMFNLQNQIRTTDTYISDMLRRMDNQSQVNQDELMKSFEELTGFLVQINKDFTAAHGEIKDLILVLQNSENANHGELLATLTEMETSLNADAVQNFDNLISSLQTIQDNLDASFTNMQNKMNNSLTTVQQNLDGSINSVKNDMTNSLTDLNNDISSNFETYNKTVTERLEQMNSSIDNQFTNITNNIVESDDSTQVYLEVMMDTMNQNFETVFQYVSNVKSMLASALLTKSVTVSQDATFAEIYQGILDVPQKVVIGVEELPGEISYDYHDHVNGAGDATHTNQSSAGGGCFTVPVYHRHVSTCYNTTYFHTHYGCPKHPVWVYWNPANPEGYWADIYDCNNQPLNDSKQELICNKNTSTVEAYDPGCGFVDHQIIAAHIIYIHPEQALQAGYQYEAETSGITPDAEVGSEIPADDENADLVPEYPIPSEDQSRPKPSDEPEIIVQPENEGQSGTGDETETGTRPETGGETGTGTPPEIGNQSETGEQSQTGNQPETGEQSETGTQSKTDEQSQTGTQSKTGEQSETESQ